MTVSLVVECSSCGIAMPDGWVPVVQRHQRNGAQGLRTPGEYFARVKAGQAGVLHEDAPVGGRDMWLTLDRP